MELADKLLVIFFCIDIEDFISEFSLYRYRRFCIIKHTQMYTVYYVPSHVVNVSDPF
jgi:hypothetical protein